MNILFIHQNFPGQFKHLAPALLAQGHTVVALGVNRTPPLPGVRHLLHAPAPVTGGEGDEAPSWLKDLHAKLARGESAAEALRALKAQGFHPDVVFAHPGWGEALYVRDVFPKSRLVVYAEYFYGSTGGDLAFDPEFSRLSTQALQRIRVKNTHLLHALHAADAALSPTEFQKGQHPAWCRQKIAVIHDGIDTDRFRPDPRASVKLDKANITLRPGDEVVTYVARQLEPYRGFHTFMRSLPTLLEMRPNARVVIAGGDAVSYGSPPPGGGTWKDYLMREVAGRLDSGRVHFVGTLPHEVLTQLMQVSAAHVYLSYPFVLSWSLLEAMSIGAIVVGSATAPVMEVIEHGRNGLLTDFFDHEALAATVSQALEERASNEQLRQAARQTILDKYDLHRVCLPSQLRFLAGHG